MEIISQGNMKFFYAKLPPLAALEPPLPSPQAIKLRCAFAYSHSQTGGGRRWLGAGEAKGAGDAPALVPTGWVEAWSHRAEGDKGEDDVRCQGQVEEAHGGASASNLPARRSRGARMRVRGRVVAAVPPDKEGKGGTEVCGGMALGLEEERPLGTYIRQVGHMTVVKAHEAISGHGLYGPCPD